MGTLRNNLKRYLGPILPILYWMRKLRKRYDKLNYYKTFLVNFRLLPFKQAIRLPIFVYGKTAIYGLAGKIIFECPIKKGMIIIGKNTDKFSAHNRSLLELNGTIIFKGTFLASNGVTIQVSHGALLEIGDIVSLGACAKIRCLYWITIGCGTGIVEECQIFDTNFHCTKDVGTGIVNNPCDKITIGKFCWVGNRSTIMKGTVLADDTIVASNSLLNKNYEIRYDDKFPILGGIPAKLIGSGKVRIYDIHEETKILNAYNNGGSVCYKTDYNHSHENAYLKRKEVFEIS